MASANSLSSRETVIRVGQGTLAFLTPELDGTMTYHPYPVKSGMSLAANLRMAFKDEEYLADLSGRATLCVASPVVLIPADEYNATDDFDSEAIYSEVITGHKGEKKITRELPELNAVALFTVNSDLLLVVNDHFRRVEVQNVMVPVWTALYDSHYQAAGARRLFAYFHDKKVDIFAFEQHRIDFANSFDAFHAHDALYFILFIWKQRGMNQKEDELFVAGTPPHADWLMKRLRTYLSNVHEINRDDEPATAQAYQPEHGKPLDLSMICG